MAGLPEGDLIGNKQIYVHPGKQSQVSTREFKNMMRELHNEITNMYTEQERLWKANAEQEQMIQNLSNRLNANIVEGTKERQSKEEIVRWENMEEEVISRKR